MYSGHMDNDREAITWYDEQNAQRKKGDLLNLPVKQEHVL